MSKSTEKLIQDALNAEKPDKRVLTDAKEVMAQRASARKKSIWQVLVPAACSFLLIASGAIFTIFNQVYSGNDSSLHIEGFALLTLSEPKGLIAGIILIAAGVFVGGIAVVLGIKTKKNK